MIVVVVVVVVVVIVFFVVVNFIDFTNLFRDYSLQSMVRDINQTSVKISLKTQ